MRDDRVQQTSVSRFGCAFRRPANLLQHTGNGSAGCRPSTSAVPIAFAVMTSSTKDAEHTAEPAAEHTIDIHTTAGKLADLRRRAEETLHPVGEAAVEKVHAKGKLT